MKVTVVTQVYNGIDYVPQTIECVLNQTHKDLEYIIIDDGSTDSVDKVIEEYAAKDDRIKFVKLGKNTASWHTFIIAAEMATGDYVTVLSSDDLWDSTFLERMVEIVKRTGAEIVKSGSYEFNPVTGERKTLKQADRFVEIENKDFANRYTDYHWYFITTDSELVSSDVVRKVQTKEMTDFVNSVSLCHVDTVYNFAFLRHCNKLCIDNSVLHGIRVRLDSASRGRYDKFRHKLSVYLYNDAIDFLKQYGPIGENNLRFVNKVYFVCLSETTKMIMTSTLSAAEKLRDLREIMVEQATNDIYNNDDQELVVEVMKNIIYCVLQCAAYVSNDNEDLNAIKKKHFPNCGVAITQQNAGLFIENATLRNLLMNDYRKPMVKYIVSLIEKQEYAKQYHLGEMLCRLSYNKPISDEISDMKFIRKYREIYLLTWSEKYNDALDKMTDILLKELVPNETFYKVYLSLAASLECADEFVFGKIKQAHYYCDNGNRARAAEILNDLADMGVEDNEEMAEVRVKI